jgi:photosystem II stability/assembly factor-like uncharacterized protein
MAPARAFAAALLMSAAGCDLLGGEGTEGDTGGTALAPTATATDLTNAVAPEAGTEVDPAATKGDVARFLDWQPAHDFLDRNIVRGAAVGASEAIVASEDNHVGVTTDAGASWRWTRHTNGWVRGIGGFEGGPYVVVGAAGYAALSDDGIVWRDLPRYTEDDLIAVTTCELGIFAITARGGYVRYSRDGSAPRAGWLPGGFKAKGLTFVSGTLVAHAGKKAYGSADGSTWTPFAKPPLISTGRFGTSAGSCSLVKSGKRRRVSCAVRGTAHGISEGVVAVEDKGTVSLTTDGGSSWSVGQLPFRGANTIFGSSAGPFYALGGGGAVAVSRDGSVWTDLAWEDPASFRAGIVDGTNIVIVGDDSTIIYSNNSGNGWEYAEAPVSMNFKTITKADNEYIISDGRSALTSPDGAEWTEDPERVFESASSGGACDGLPAPTASCRYLASIESPDDLPDLGGIDFHGDSGIAFGRNGLVAFTSDGGTSWSAKKSLGMGSIRVLEVAGQHVLVSNGSKIATSSDAGASFSAADVPGGNVAALLVAAGGRPYAAGRKGAIAVADTQGTSWSEATSSAGSKVDFVALFEAAGAVYAAGSRGELFRSADGTTFLPAVTGRKEPIQAMTSAEGNDQLVLAVTGPGRKSGNMLLRSEDGGLHFSTIHEISDWSQVHRLDLTGAQLH